MAKRLFGTDGIRGVAGKYPLDAQTVVALGAALSEHLKDRGLAAEPVLIGMDTRESGPAIASQLAHGLQRGGVPVRFAGVVTTPCVAWLTRQRGFAAGVMISASHNPFEDNGIKIFGSAGYKLPDSNEVELEAVIDRLRPSVEATPATALLNPDYDTRPYADFLLSTIGKPLRGMKVVLDCGNGAASPIAPALFREAGAEVIAIFDQPDGRNINLHCGALHLESLRERVLSEKADAGVAFDGDADRAMMISASGRLIDGDAILLIGAGRLQREGQLNGNIAVSTVMANLGLEKALERAGIAMVRTPVGDKYVLEEMLRLNAAIGGEQSGHMIFRSWATTGDGMLTALQTLETTVVMNKSLDDLAKDLTVYPQTLVNVRVAERRPLEQLVLAQREIHAAEAALGSDGRVVVRFSGTEPLARVMVEAREESAVHEWAERIAGAIRKDLAVSVSNA